jgi:peptidoglycan/LPS O-acetylase OafA/YrhL
MMDRWIRWSTSAVVVVVAAFAAIVSYSHIYDLGRAHGQSGTAARLLPLSVDGLILAASLVMLHEARQRRRAPGLARSMLGLGVAATVAANVAFGMSYGLLGAVISAWPAVAFVGAAEMVIGLIRRTGHQVAEAPDSPVSSLVPQNAVDAARAAFEASVMGGNPLSQNQLTTRFGVTRTTARQILAGANGHAPGGSP